MQYVFSLYRLTPKKVRLEKTVSKQSHTEGRPRSGAKERPVPRLVEFPEARGRTVERVELNLDSDFHCISIRFQDETDLTFVIDPALTFRADYSKWKAGNRRC